MVIPTYKQPFKTTGDASPKFIFREIEVKWESRGTIHNKKNKRNSLLKKSMKQTSSSYQTEFKKEVIQMLKELSKIINRNAYYCNKELDY